MQSLSSLRIAGEIILALATVAATGGLFKIYFIDRKKLPSDIRKADSDIHKTDAESTATLITSINTVVAQVGIECKRLTDSNNELRIQNEELDRKLFHANSDQQTLELMVDILLQVCPDADKQVRDVRERMLQRKRERQQSETEVKG
jgi:coenzyme F420-reducing hydrogenase gamma subunit